MSETAERRAATALEYGQFVANQPIYFNGVLAYAEGAQVPASNVALHGYDVDGYVDRVADAPEPQTEPDVGDATAPDGGLVDLKKAQRAGTEG